MDASLSPELARFVEERVASVQFQSASEAVKAALLLLQEHLGEPARMEALRAAIDEGIASLDRGEGMPGDKALGYLR